MVLLLTGLILWNARTIVRGYYHCWHWGWVLVPGFLMGATLVMLVQIITTHVYFGTSLWVPDWKCPDFLWMTP